MKKTELLPKSRNAFVLGRSGDLFTCLPPGIPEVRSLPEDGLPDTVFLGEKDGPEGRQSLAECFRKKIPFVIVGRGWSRGLSTYAGAGRPVTKIIGPGSAGLAESAPGPGGAIVLATGSEIFKAVMGEAAKRSVPVEYGLSFGKKTDLDPMDAARSLLGERRGGRLFLFIGRRLKRGRELLEFAAEAARSHSITAILEYDPLPGDDPVEAAALRQMGIITVGEPSMAVDIIALHRAFAGEIPPGVFPDLGRGELGRLALGQWERRYAHFSKHEEPSFPCLKTAPGGEGLAVEGGSARALIPEIGRGLDALSQVLGAGRFKSGLTGEKDGSLKCPIHPRPTEYDAKILLKTFGIPVARERLCRSFREAAEAAGSIGYPVAIKVMSPAILSKSDARVIALNLQDEEELRNAYGRTLEKARKTNPGARIRGVLVQEMVRGGSEWRMEFRRDSRFGPVVEVSAAGVYGELLPDGVIRVAPFDREEARAMILESRGRPLLSGGWMREKLDAEAFASALSAFSRLAFCEREVSRLEVNPIFVNKKGVLVVDAFLELKGREK